MSKRERAIVLSCLSEVTTPILMRLVNDFKESEEKTYEKQTEQRQNGEKHH